MDETVGLPNNAEAIHDEKEVRGLSTSFHNTKEKNYR